MNGTGDRPTFSVGELLFLRRREVFVLGGFALVSATLGSAVSAEEGASADAMAGQSSTVTDRSVERPVASTTDLPGGSNRIEQRSIELREQLGLSLRAPQLTYDDDWPILGELGSRPDISSQRQSAFFVDSANQTFLSSEGAPLDTALRWMLPNGAEGSGTPADDTRRINGFASGADNNPPSKMMQALETVEWAELGRATLDMAGEIAVDYTKDFTLERIAEALGTQVMKRWLNQVFLVIDVLNPEVINGGRKEELTYLDRMSPAERRDFFHQLMNRRTQLPTTLPHNGPTLRAPR